MLKLLRTASTALAFASCLTVAAQTPKQNAEAKGMAAIKLMDEGKLDEAIGLLQEARQLDPNRSDYPYELGYAYYMQKKYPEALELTAPLIKKSDASDRTFELVGNIYDNSGNSPKAIETYEAGLHKFPNSGRLQLELGTMYMLYKKDYDKAISYFEDGIKVAPTFSSNYYWAAKLFCSSKEEAWGMLYGELFINLEPNSQRTAEISKILYDTYKSGITFKGTDSSAVNFSQNIMVLPAKGKKIKLPYAGMVYVPVLLMSTTGETQIDLNSLDRIRTNFVETYYRFPAGQQNPNVLFDYQRQIKAAGHFAAYNHWLLAAGDEASFMQWQKANPEKWSSFLAWYQANRIKLDSQHLFYRAQYE